ncbi:hypothetical protein MMC13_002586 [Lambiella insularis]|nr:hypothetical protein [Lambiella insularis]
MDDQAMNENDNDQEDSKLGAPDNAVTDALLGEDNADNNLQHTLLGPETEKLSLYEKKALLVNRELDSHGMGRYQWWIFFLCGFGYFIDLVWVHAFGLTAKPLQDEFGFGDNGLGRLFSVFAIGLTIGALVWGVLVDIIGRQWAFNLTCLISSVFGTCLGLAESYEVFLLLTIVVGFGVGGNIPIDTTICLEFLPHSQRRLLAVLSAFQPLGVIVCSGIAYAFIPTYHCGNLPDGNPLPPCSSVAAGTDCCTKASNYGWRYTLFTIGAITFTAFLLRFVVFRFQESPKFLLYKGRDEDAVKVLHNIAKFNGRKSTITLADFQALDDEDSSATGEIGSTDDGESSATPKSFRNQLKSESSRWKMLFANAAIARLTVLVWITYIFDFFGFSIAGSFLPIILARKNSAIHVSIDETYRNYIIIYTPGIIGVLLGAMMYSATTIGRKWGMVISSALMSLSLFLFATINTEASNIGLNMMEYFFQSMFNAILYGWTPEVFPAPIRGTAAGLASFWGRIFSILAPLIGAQILEVSLNGVLYLGGAATLIATLAVICMPSRQMGAQSY